MTRKVYPSKDQQELIFREIADILGAVSSPVRVKLIHFLSQGPLSVEVLAKKIDQTVANTSMHLRKMLASNVVEVTVQAQKRLYSLHPAMFDFWELCQNLVQEINPQLEMSESQTHGDLGWNEPLKITIKMARNNEVALIDVRPEDEVIEALDQINVINLPMEKISKSLNKLPKRKPILIFCRGRFCALSSQAVIELRKKGFKAYRLNESWYALKNAL